MIEVRNLTKWFGPVLAVKDISFDVAEGQIVGFLGPNGAGKSTTLRILTGYQAASSGSARVAGFDVFTESMKVRQHIGYLPESTPMYPEMRVREFLKFRAKLKGVPRAEIAKRIEYVSGECWLEEFIDRPIGQLSKGMKQRVGLADALINDPKVLFLDEPTIGLHPRDTDRLVDILEHLRDIGNTVIVVEHERDLMRRADQIVDLGPGSGRHGGQLIFQGSYEAILTDETSLTGAYLSERQQIPVPTQRRPVDPDRVVVVENARQHNLKRLDVRFPLGLICCVTGVSGSGKSTLVNDTLYQGLRRLKGQMGDQAKVGAHDAIRGHGFFDQIEMVDQSPIGRTPRSNPATYTKTFDAIRQLLAGTYQARVRGLRPGYFSFNVPGGRCEGCQGEGVVKIEMQFLADLYLECEACKGKRYKKDVLEIRYKGKNVDDILNMTIDEAVEFFEGVATVINKLKVLREIGLGYLTLGQPATTLSGGGAKRIKLAAHMGRRTKEHTLYVFDEPTTGLHFDDIRKLLAAFNRLVDEGHSVIIVEHNLEVIKSADWVIDLGPEGGRRGGFIVAEGTPADLAAHAESHTGGFLRAILG